MLKKILVVVAALVVVFIIVVAMQPADFRVSRSTTIAAPPEVLFAQVNTMRNWEGWNPWGKMDPDAKMTYEGPASGVGASYSWSGNSKVGAGRNTIVESKPNELVRLKIEFLKPFQATNTAEFTFQPEGNQTKVTWSMFGKNNFFFKAFSLFMNCDKMVGPDFEKGLADMKAIAEAKSH